MNATVRRLNVLLTIGGGFTGIAVTLQLFFTTTESNPLIYAMLMFFVALYGYGVYAGFRLAEREEKMHLIVFYLLQVPWVSSPILAYRFASGFMVTVAIVSGQFSGGFRFGSDWQMSFLQAAPWGIGLNVFALAMAVYLLFAKAPADAPPSTPPTLPSTPPSSPPELTPPPLVPERPDAQV